MAWQIDTFAFKDLTDADRAAWLALRDANPAHDSPYHHPTYHQFVDQFQGNVKISLAREDGTLKAVLPWQGGRFARPSGSPLSDYQAVIGASDEPNNVTQLLKRTRVGAFHFTAMPSAEGTETARCEIIDPDTWRTDHNGSYRRHLKSTRRRIRKSEEDFGPRRVVIQSRDIDAFQALMRWKAEKFTETGKYNVLDNPGTGDLIRALWERGPQADLRADLHVLYFGDRIAACDLGLTDGRVFHSWIVGYDSELMSYAPGIQLLEATINAIPETGYQIIDLGPGLEGYKRHYATHAREVDSGVITLPGPVGSIAALYDTAENGLRSGTNDLLGKMRRRYSQVAACDPSLSGRMSAMMRAAHFEIRQSLS